MPTQLDALDRQLLTNALEHVVRGADVVQRCTRDLEHVVKAEDPHPLVTTNTVYQRLTVVVARLATAHDQLAELLGRAEQLAREGARS